MAHVNRVLLLTVLGAGALLAVSLDDLLARVARYEYGGDPSAVREFEQLYYKAVPAEAVAMEPKVIGLLQATQSTPAAKEVACRALSVIGTEASVPALASQLVSPAMAEIARYALERIPSGKATAVLRAALPRTQGKTQAGLINTLARRCDQLSAAPIAGLLGSKDSIVASAAANALGDLGGPAAPLMKVPLTADVADALLKIGAGGGACRASARGDNAAARYLYASSNSDAVRAAALRQLPRAEQVRALDSPSPAIRAAAVQLLAADTRLLIAHLPKADKTMKVQILTALQDPESLQVFTGNLSSDSPAIRIAALRGLERTGTPAQIPVLAASAANSAGDEQAAARSSLARIRGEAADRVILEAIPSAEPKIKIELIRAAAERGSKNAGPVLLAAAAGENAAVRREAVRALREIAGPSDAPALIASLTAAPGDAERDEYARALASAIRRSKTGDTSAVVKAYNSTSDSGVRASLIGVMSMVGSNEALPIVREALKSPDASLQRAAINALSEWPTPEPLDDLIALARAGASPSQQVLALRGYIKLVQLPVQRTPEETTKLIAAAFNAAKRAEEKKAALAALQRVFTEEALQLAKSALGDPAIAAEAQRAVTALERGLSFRRK